ncbi:hypothetical protein [Schlesneria paludicola]|uniref:hypothetical protein n=1 Tax=Schlesneria paludicola TaxID=360056 RepID=UPI00029AFE08|nr:hypothetical protein [Schlesneria paludicola]
MKLIRALLIVVMTGAMSIADETAATRDPLTQPARDLVRQMNDFCVAMHGTYNKMAEFGEAYREAYDLLILAKQIDGSISSAASMDSIKEQIAEFDSEIHHVEHHLDEFAKIQGAASKVSQDAVVKNLEQVETTLTGMLKTLGIRRKQADDDSHGSANTTVVNSSLNPVLFASSSKELTIQMNEFCSVMHRTYNQMPEFGEAYREAYDLLKLAKQVESQVASGSPVGPIGEQLTEIDGEIHHVEQHLGEFASSQGPTNKAAQDAVTTSLEKVESVLDGMLKQLGIRRKGADGHDHGSDSAHNGTGGPAEIPLSQLTQSLTSEITSFCNAMNHNYKNNPEFPEAYKEAYALYEMSKKITDLTRKNELNDECKGLLSEFDGEIHHMEEHVNGFKADDKGGSKRVKRKLADVETALHAVMSRAGIKRKHVD